MAQPVSTLICFLAVIGVVMVARYYGRTVGMLAAATCGASVAYVMPPAFSFEVDSFLDQGDSCRLRRRQPAGALPGAAQV